MYPSAETSSPPSGHLKELGNKVFPVLSHESVTSQWRIQNGGLNLLQGAVEGTPSYHGMWAAFMQNHPYFQKKKKGSYFKNHPVPLLLCQPPPPRSTRDLAANLLLGKSNPISRHYTVYFGDFTQKRGSRSLILYTGVKLESED